MSSASTFSCAVRVWSASLIRGPGPIFRRFGRPDGRGPNGRERPAWCGPRVGHRGPGVPAWRSVWIIQVCDGVLLLGRVAIRDERRRNQRHPRPAARPPRAWPRRSPRAHTPTRPSRSWRSVTRPTGRRAVSMIASCSSQSSTSVFGTPGVAVRPAIDRDREDVARGVEAAGPEHARQIRAYRGLVVFEPPREQQPARRAQRRARIVDSGDDGHVHQVQHDRLAPDPGCSDSLPC